jgi:hypothetical protein
MDLTIPQFDHPQIADLSESRLDGETVHAFTRFLENPGLGYRWRCQIRHCYIMTYETHMSIIEYCALVV